MHKQKPYITKRFTSFFVMGFVNSILSLQALTPAFAHAPHDVIKSLAISSNYAFDRTVFVVIRGNLLKSVNRGVSWKRLVQGINSRSELQNVVVDPKHPTTVYLSTYSDGIYKSEDSGQSWHQINSGLTSLKISKIQIPSSSSNGVAFAISSASLYRTLDGGASWSEIYRHPVSLTEIAAFPSATPDTSRVLIGDTKGAVFESTHGGLVWTKILDKPDCGAINSIGKANNAAASATLFVGTEKCGVFRSTDAGKSFQTANANIEDLNIRSVTMSPNFFYDNTVFASTRTKAIFVSTDGGLSWKKYTQGITTDPQAQLSGSPDFYDVRISPNFKNDQTVFLGGFNGLFKSIDKGMGWQELDTMPRTLIQGFAISPTYPKDPEIVMTTYLGGIFRATNNGRNWEKLPVTYRRGYDIVYSPAFAQDQTLFASIHPNLVAKSTDNGNKWSNHTVSVLNGEEGPSILAISPSFLDDHTVFVGTRFGNVNKSSDSGETYSVVYDEPSSSLCSDSCLSSLDISPNYANDHTVMLATRGSGIHISRDAGNTWQLKVPTIAIGQQIQIAVSPNYANDHTVFFGGTSGLYKTTNDFVTWGKVYGNVLSPYDFIEELALSPDFKNDKTLLLSIRGKGLLRSEDAGVTFQPTGLSLLKNNNAISLWYGFPISAQSMIQFSPNFAVDKTVFASSSERLFISHDGGSSWKLVVANTQLK